MYIFILYVCMRVPQLLGCSQQQVSCASARSIVVLSQPRVKPDESDARSLRTVLSLSQVLHPVDDPVRAVQLCLLCNYGFMPNRLLTAARTPRPTL